MYIYIYYIYNNVIYNIMFLYIIYMYACIYIYVCTCFICVNDIIYIYIYIYIIQLLNTEHQNGSLGQILTSRYAHLIVQIRYLKLGPRSNAYGACTVLKNLITPMILQNIIVVQPFYITDYPYCIVY